MSSLPMAIKVLRCAHIGWNHICNSLIHVTRSPSVFTASIRSGSVFAGEVSAR